jgi:quercetin 2,3-dioxygenase
MTDDDGTAVRVVVGSYRGYSGPVDGIAAEPQYLDITIPAGKRKVFKVDTRRNAFAYVFDGKVRFRDAAQPFGVLVEKEFAGEEMHLRDMSGNRTLVIFGAGDEVVAEAGEGGCRFLLVSGAPIGEPVAWHGPIVMNTREELVTAVRELQSGTFIKEGVRGR